MSETVLMFEVHCLQPRWIALEQARYRLYVNDDLITERTWVWDQNSYVEETLVVKVNRTDTHTIRLEHIKFSRGHLAQFGLRTFRLNGWPKPDNGGHSDTLSFTLT